MTAHVYWRVNITADQGGGNYPGMAELGLMATIGGSSIATGGTATAQSTLYGPPSVLFDGSASTFWVANGGVPQWVQYQFPSAVTINQISIQNAASYLGETPIAMTVQSSDDGTTFTSEWTITTPATWTAGEVRAFPRPAPIPQYVSKMGQYVVEGIPSLPQAVTKMGQYVVEGSPSVAQSVAKMGQYVIEGPPLRTRSQAMMGTF